jgi:hypothetical protein
MLTHPIDLVAARSFVPEDGDSNDEDAHAPEAAHPQDSSDEDVDSAREGSAQEVSRSPETY